MAQRRSPSATLKKTMILTLTAMMIGAPTITLAGTACEQGLIKFLEHEGGGDSTILVGTDKSPAKSWLKATSSKGAPATEIWYKSSDTRWRDRFNLLRMAFALQLPVKIVSEDDNCMGNTDEFTITVCTVDGPC